MNPVKALRRFHGDCRDLNPHSELSNSSIGRLLGVTELESNNDEGEDDDAQSILLQYNLKSIIILHDSFTTLVPGFLIE